MNHQYQQNPLVDDSNTVDFHHLTNHFSSLSFQPSTNHDNSLSWSPFSYTPSYNNENHNQKHKQQTSDSLAFLQNSSTTTTWSTSSSLSKSSAEITPTDSEIERRALAATGLNVSAPEFIPSFVSTPTSSQPSQTSSQPQSNITSPYQTSASNPLSTSSLFNAFHSYPIDEYQVSETYGPENDEAGVYSNVTDLVSIDNNFSSLLHDDSNNLVQSASLEDAVNHFDAQFPALKPQTPVNPNHSNHTQSLFPQALGWDALRREQETKKLAQARRVQDEEQRRALEATIMPILNTYEETPVTKDVGDLWVQTGKSVANLYEELRAEAAQEASLRNKYFDRAAAAFRRNDGATAKKLGAQGREANERMKALHRQAADAIFAARNPSHIPNVVDLHGLHVSEAIERLPSAIHKATADKVRILTGTGHHTKGTGRARLRPAVKKWLHENHYFFEEVVDANDHVGSFIVEIKK